MNYVPKWYRSRDPKTEEGTKTMIFVKRYAPGTVGKHPSCLGTAPAARGLGASEQRGAGCCQRGDANR